MSKLASILAGAVSKQMGRIKILDSSLLGDESAEGMEFMSALKEETRGLREDEVVRGAVVELSLIHI